MKLQPQEKQNIIFKKADIFLLPQPQEIVAKPNLKPKPFVKWVGGKRQLLKQFYEKNLFPKKFNQYFEPFLGGGAMFFELLPQKAFLSDLNQDLIKTYNAIKFDVENLILHLKKHKNDKEYFLEIRAQNSQNLSDIEIASRFIYLNKTCFNGLYRVNKKGQFNTPFGNYANPIICDEENLRAVSQVLRNVEICYQDYKEVLKEAQKNDFIYFDPPYYPVSKTASFTSYTNQDFLQKEQIELRNVFAELSKKGCFVMLSNSCVDFINEIYCEIDGVKITEIMASRAINSDASKRGKISELLITNY